MNDLLEISLSALIIDTIINMYLFYYEKGGTSVREWYINFKTSAAIMDVTSIIIAVFLAIKLTDNIYKQLLYVVLIQLFHDIFMGWFLLRGTSNHPKNTILDLWCRYGKELGSTILFVDAFMLILTILLKQVIHDNLNKEWMCYLLILFTYVLLFIINCYHL